MLNENRLNLIGLCTGFLMLLPIVLWLFTLGIEGACTAVCGLCDHLF